MDDTFLSTDEVINQNYTTSLKYTITISKKVVFWFMFCKTEAGTLQFSISAFGAAQICNHGIQFPQMFKHLFKVVEMLSSALVVL